MPLLLETFKLFLFQNNLHCYRRLIFLNVRPVLKYLSLQSGLFWVGKDLNLVNKDGLPTQQWTLWLQMLERVFIHLQYCHNGGTKCEANVQAFFYTQLCVLSTPLYNKPGWQFGLAWTRYYNVQQFIGSLQFWMTATLNFVYYLEPIGTVKVTQNISFLHSFRQHCASFICILSKFHKRFNVNCVVQITIIHCSMNNMNTKLIFATA